MAGLAKCILERTSAGQGCAAGGQGCADGGCEEGLAGALQVSWRRRANHVHGTSGSGVHSTPPFFAGGVLTNQFTNGGSFSLFAADTNISPCEREGAEFYAVQALGSTLITGLATPLPLLGLLAGTLNVQYFPPSQLQAPSAQPSHSSSERSALIYPAMTVHCVPGSPLSNCVAGSSPRLPDRDGQPECTGHARCDPVRVVVCERALESRHIIWGVVGE